MLTQRRVAYNSNIQVIKAGPRENGFAILEMNIPARYMSLEPM